MKCEFCIQLQSLVLPEICISKPSQGYRVHPGSDAWGMSKGRAWCPTPRELWSTPTPRPSPSRAGGDAMHTASSSAPEREGAPGQVGEGRTGVQGLSPLPFMSRLPRGS